ncbi:MAG: hypothetical protein M1831_003769 [Alyxoria varia]|nr:MAG: hypothetical protein M1831_003769 [Alyxoria varia]
MPRKSFILDLSAAKAVDFPGISQIASKEDGEFSFLVQPDGVSITVSVMEPSTYPDSHACFIFADDDAPPSIAKALEKIPDQSGKKIAEILTTVSDRLVKGEAAPNDDHGEMTDIQSEWEADDSSDDEDQWGMDGTYPDAASFTHNSGAPTGLNTSFGDRARQDLEAAKLNGLKIGALGRLNNGTPCFITIACRFSKLGISEEAMQAWSVNPSHYLILLLYYPTGYKSWDFLKSLQPYIASQHLKMHVGMCDTYKPGSFDEAKRSMNLLPDVRANERDEQSSSFRATFVSGPMDDMLNERFLFILKERIFHRRSWTEAEILFEESFRHRAPSRPSELLPELPLKFPKRAPLQLSENNTSLPLFAYEFLLRHFVHCTKFCLVCHRRLKTDVEAIKPYVCESDLCLYQYMSLGLGPSIDHEIIAQPYVVDTLISFCYASSTCKKLESFPTGLALNVPHPRANVITSEDGKSIITYEMFKRRSRSGSHPYRSTVEDIQSQQSNTTEQPQTYKGLLDKQVRRLTIEESDCPLKTGDWILACSTGSQHLVLCKIRNSQYFPVVDIGEIVALEQSMTLGETGPYNPPEGEFTQPILKEFQDVAYPVRFTMFDVNLDGLDDNEKCQSIALLLDGLPSVIEMRNYCLKNPDRKLSDWTDKINPAAFALLRWIIASNRSCILQLDEFSDPTATSETTSTALGVRHERVSGMNDYMQFRFATGSPEKEARFIQSVAGKTLAKTYPTLFAWHGSPLENWHSIIRQGLHYKHTAHGRAYGHGCYHAKDFYTSGTYSSRGPRGGSFTPCWPNSCLQFSTAMALSEIVNCPKEFQSSNPYYVVQHIDWIQTRYLFVNPRKSFSFSEGQTESFLPQDPAQTPKGASGQPIALPMTTVSSSRRVQYGKRHQSIKNEDVEMTDADASDGDSDGLSVATLEEDTRLLRASENDESSSPQIDSHSKYYVPRPTQPAIPVLAYSPVLPTTQLLPPPDYATSSASKQLQREMRSLLSTQEGAVKNNTLADLGWFLHSDHITETGNLYQWIISLHSFPLELPLAKDMEKAGVQEVLLEMRFAANFPLSPPFVRVIRPRFLPFLQGGGGHVTAGGSICMELLTNDGWLPGSNIESVLLQVRMAIMSLDPRPAKLDGGSSQREYSVGEAVEAYIRVCRTHGWRIPDEIRQMAPASGSY